MAPQLKDDMARLIVVVDTNAIYTGGAKAAVRRDLAVFVSTTRRGPGLAVTWVMPEVVALERAYQMYQHASTAMPHADALAAILGIENPFREAITPDAFVRRVEEEVALLGFDLRGVAVQSVDWAGLIRSAALRRPPFSPGPSEKGFRDAVVLETLKQVAREYGCSAVVLLGADALLAAAARAELGPSLRIVDERRAFESLFSTALEGARTLLAAEEAQFAALLKIADDFIGSGCEELDVMNQSIVDLGACADAGTRRFAAAIARGRPDPHLLTAVGTDLSAGMAAATEQLTSALPSLREKLLLAIGALARAAERPLAFSAEERPELAKRLDIYRSILASMASTREHISALESALPRDSRVITLPITPLSSALLAIIESFREVERIGQAAASALSGLLEPCEHGAT